MSGYDNVLGRLRAFVWCVRAASHAAQSEKSFINWRTVIPTCYSRTYSDFLQTISHCGIPVNWKWKWWNWKLTSDIWAWSRSAGGLNINHWFTGSVTSQVHFSPSSGRLTLLQISLKQFLKSLSICPSTAGYKRNITQYCELGLFDLQLVHMLWRASEATHDLSLVLHWMGIVASLWNEIWIISKTPNVEILHVNQRKCCQHSLTSTVYQNERPHLCTGR